MSVLLLMAMGGALGTLARYGLGGWIQEQAGSAFPWGTLLVNITGSLLLSFTFRWLEQLPVAAEWRTTIGIGFCGAYTTFSTFSYETVRLLEDGQFRRASIYIAASVTFSLIAALAGFRLAALVLRKG